jgi:two-component sensor histidine kinase
MREDSISAAVGPLISLSFVDEINHRILNEYAAAVSTLSQGALNTSEADVRSTINHATTRLMAHADLHRALLRPATAQGLNAADHLARICGAFARTLDADDPRIVMRAENLWLHSDGCWRLGLIVAELLRNAIRHGAAQGSGAVAVELRVEPQRVVCMVGNRGRAAIKRGSGRGMAIVRFLAGELGGQVDWDFSDQGSTVSVLLPRDDSVAAPDGLPIVEQPGRSCAPDTKV